MARAFYSPAEVVWLLGLSRQEAIDYDATPRDSCADLSADTASLGSSSDDGTVPVIARWHDVRAARDRVCRSKLQAQIARLTAEGFTQEEIARVTGISQPTVSRRLRATLREIIEELGADDTPEAMPVTPVCLFCNRPRARIMAVERKRRGGRQVLREERHAHVCVQHLSVEMRARVVA